MSTSTASRPPPVTREAEVAQFVVLFDRPDDLDESGYRGRSRKWIAEFARMDGFKSFSAHWSATGETPNTMVLVAVETTEAAVEALKDPVLIAMFEDMRHHGCRNIMARAFKSSDLFPDPITEDN
jgi:hypothetical protein